MNKIYAAIIIAAATVSAGCKSTCGGDAERREVTFSVSADTYSVAGGTRAVTGDDLKTRFEDGDMIGVFAVKHAVGEHPEIAATGNYMHNVAMTYDAANDEWTMAETCYYPIDGQMLDFYAYYPYMPTINPGNIVYNPSSHMHEQMFARVQADTRLTTVGFEFGHAFTMFEVRIPDAADGTEVYMENVPVYRSSANIYTGVASATGEAITAPLKMEDAGSGRFRAWVVAGQVAAGTRMLRITAPDSPTIYFNNDDEINPEAGDAFVFDAGLNP